jgi:hypothetical protein
MAADVAIYSIASDRLSNKGIVMMADEGIVLMADESGPCK